MRAALTLILSLAATSAAGDFSLSLPIDCTLGQDCYIQQIMDHDPSPTSNHDFTCGSLTYDGHSGSDFALPSLAAQAGGVNVLAAAAGKVVGVRDEMPDMLQLSPDAPDVTDRECGNGLVIAHTGDYTTQYCHMALGSLTVKAGQMVQAGDILGQVGLSGNTQFPHLHFDLSKAGISIDPFDTNGAQTCGDNDHPSLWDSDVPLPAGGIISLGISQSIPDLADVRAGMADTGSSSNAPALVGWVYFFGTRAGDIYSITIDGPEGSVFTHQEALDRTQAVAMRAGGRKTPAGGWPVGDYTVRFTLDRAGTIIATRSQAFEIN